jgi:Protein of unknown function (DUF4058)
MPIHDWRLVDAGIFHHFHHSWIEEIQRVFNRGLLPPEYYALAEQIAGGLGPDVLTLEKPQMGPVVIDDTGGGVAVTTTPPKVRFRARAEPAGYAAKAKSVVIRHRSNHRVIAMVEIVSPGNKNSRHGIRSFVEKAVTALRAGIHLLIVDLFPPGPRDPQGIHKAIWDELIENDFMLPEDKPLTLAAYVGDTFPEAFVEPVGVHDVLPEMPVFLTPDVYIPTPLETTYQLAWEALPAFWREVLEKPASS